MLKRASVLFFVLFIIFILNAFLNVFPTKNVPDGFRPAYGVSYSFEQAGWYGLNPREAYTELLNSIKFEWVRLPFFWDLMADENGNLKIDDLKFAIEEAKKRNVKVVIALGLKTPYYPEYHLPNYIAEKVKFGETIDVNHPVANDLLNVDKQLVEQLSGYDNIAYWQVENEPFLANVNNLKIDESLVKAEVDLVRSLDPNKRPIILSHVGPATFDRRYRVLLNMLQPGDILGVNAYFKTQGTGLLSFKILDREIHIGWPKWLVWPVQSWYGLSPSFSSLGKEVNERNVKLWVLEMQAEPYIRTLSDAKNEEFFYKPDDILKANDYLRASQVESVGLWGAPFWQYRQKSGDETWMDAVKGLVN